MGVRSEYGFVISEQDHSLFYNKRHFEIIWEGFGAVDNSPAVSRYLKRANTAGNPQILYVPAGLVFVMFTSYIATDASLNIDGDLIRSIVRNSGGTLTVTNTNVAGSQDPALVPTANSTADGIEMVLTSTAVDNVVTYCRAISRIIAIDLNTTGQSQLQLTGATSAATS